MENSDNCNPFRFNNIDDLIRKPSDQVLSCAFLFHSHFVTIFFVYLQIVALNYDLMCCYAATGA